MSVARLFIPCPTPPEPCRAAIVTCAARAVCVCLSSRLSPRSPIRIADACRCAGGGEVLRVEAEKEDSESGAMEELEDGCL